QAERDAFVPQLDITHQAYNNIWPPRKPDFMSSSFLVNKRNNAQLLLEKGLGSRHRIYEIRGVSQMGGEAKPPVDDGTYQSLDLAKVMSQFIDMLDAWVESGVAPPPNRSDWPILGDADSDGVIDHPA